MGQEAPAQALHLRFPLVTEEDILALLETGLWEAIKAHGVTWIICMN